MFIFSYVTLIFPHFIHSYPEFSNLPWIYPKEPHGNLRNSMEQKKLKFAYKFGNNKNKNEKNNMILTTRACRQGGS